MSYDAKLAGRIRNLLESREGLSERRMFGGIAFLLNGNMCCGVTGTALMLRLGKAGADEALSEPNVRPMDFTGKPMTTMVYVDPQGTAKEDDLSYWVNRAAAYAETMPPK